MNLTFYSCTVSYTNQQTHDIASPQLACHPHRAPTQMARREQLYINAEREREREREGTHKRPLVMCSKRRRDTGNTATVRAALPSI